MDSRRTDRSNKLLQSLAQLRGQGERCRVDLYWSVQQVRKNCVRSKTIKAWWARKRLMRLYDPDWA